VIPRQNRSITIWLLSEYSEPGINSLRRTFSQPVYQYQLYGGALLLALALCWLIVVSGMEVRKLEVRDYATRRCELVTNQGGPTLRILDAVYKEDLGLMDSWCHSSGIARHFGAIELLSVHRDHIDLRQLYETRYDLLLAKPELIAGLGRVGTDGNEYELLANYPAYGSQLVSLHGLPELSRDWLAGKRFGLLDDPNSVSAYQIPMAALRRAGLEEVPTFVYFRSYRQLYKALFEGRIDVIPALLSEEGPDSRLQLPPGLVLEETIPGPAWFIRRELLQDREHCDLLAALEQLGPTAEIDYFRHLKVVRPCDED
jgi:hypothetical protein